MFREHGRDSVPVLEACRIAIVPNDDRDLGGETEQFVFDVDSEEAIPVEVQLAVTVGSVETVVPDLTQGLLATKATVRRTRNRFGNPRNPHLHPRRQSHGRSLGKSQKRTTVIVTTRTAVWPVV
ncbi:hypothetical protein [Natronococcus occultus]|uniref:Uncharacterized protein n=1 Tax=Natronococcus occultus SP4 TaxID=694430 RepID=L0K5Q3_9EURY|nr:hypothetical protein [Natronococcus occultus]AGB39850.1 hypothetical protein Natoc_4142 [Natronococcus occultus SP4]